VDDFSLRWLEVSAKTGLGLTFVKGAIQEAVRDRFDRRSPSPIGAGRIKVRNRLRQMLEADQKLEPSKRQHRLLERAEFDRLCDEIGWVSDKEALLDYLHQNGVIRRHIPVFFAIYEIEYPLAENGINIACDKGRYVFDTFDEVAAAGGVGMLQEHLSTLISPTSWAGNSNVVVVSRGPASFAMATTGPDLVIKVYTPSAR
jgi:hypothetical protein